MMFTGNNRNNLNIIVTDPTSREFGRVDMKSLTRLPIILQELTPRELGSIYVLRIISKLDEVPTRELSSYIKTELYKFYRLVITGEDTHCKQTIKKAYIMLLERALLILFII
ncbi:hypothetical protein HBH95_008350 [Parastagonospora nodorum]|nr:hypothetical protein HBH95_008350 [Parastagonospora nodorum]